MLYYLTMSILINLIVSAVVIFAAAYLLPGVHIRSFGSAVVVAIVLALVNLLVRPILVVLTLPITILTLGLFLVVINALLILLVSSIVSGFKVDSFWWALLMSIIISLINAVLHR